MRLIKWLGKILLWTVISVVVLVGALLLLNAVDEDLNPEVASRLKPRSSGIPDADNGFFVIVGFKAPAGEDPHAFGKRNVSELNGLIGKKLNEAHAKLNRGGLDFKGFKKRPCAGRTAESCLREVRQGAPEVRRIISANQELLQRYESLYRYPRLDPVSVGRFESSYVGFEALLTAQSLKLAQIALLVEDGNTGAALDELERDIALSRKLIAGSWNLHAKYGSISMLQRDYTFLAELLRARPKEFTDRAARIAALTAPFGPAERDLDAVYRGELNGLASLYHVYKTGENRDLAMISALDLAFSGQDFIEQNVDMLDPVATLFLKTNATLNLSWAHYQRLSRLSTVPAARIQPALSNHARETRESILDWRMAYNPVGKLLAANVGIIGPFTGWARWAESAAYVDDLDGLARLVALQAHIVLQEIPEAGIPQLLATSDKRLFDPYTGKPMQWDAVARQLWFKPQSDQAKRDKIGGREDRIAVGL